MLALEEKRHAHDSPVQSHIALFHRKIAGSALVQPAIKFGLTHMVLGVGNLLVDPGYLILFAREAADAQMGVVDDAIDPSVWKMTGQGGSHRHGFKNELETRLFVGQFRLGFFDRRNVF